jgi:hypothetical protein
LINIYDDEESVEVSLVTIIQITEEKEPDKAFSKLPMLKFGALHRMNRRSKLS